MRLKNIWKNKNYRFIFLGIFNVFISNLILQILLQHIGTFIATFFSQLINFLLGYYLYGKKVFKLNKLTNLVFRKYFLLAFILWILNFRIIRLFFYLGVNKNISALFVVPLLVLISYFFQKRYVFK